MPGPVRQGEPLEQRLEQAHLDMGPDAGPLPGQEGGQNGLGSHRSPGDVGNGERGGAGGQPKTVGQVDQAGEGLDGAVERHLVGNGTIGSEAGDAAVHEAPIDQAEPGGGQVEPLHDSGTEVLHQDVGGCHQVQQHAPVPRRT